MELSRRPGPPEAKAQPAGDPPADGVGVWAVVQGGGRTTDDFETRATVFISQEPESIQPLLHDFLRLRHNNNVRDPSGADGPGGAVELAAEANAATHGTAGGDSVDARLAAAIEIYSISFSERWWEPREWRVVRAPLLECVLNHALNMNEMLRPEHCEVMRKVTAARSGDRIRDRFSQARCKAWSDPHEEWRYQLTDWQVLLQPYPWNRVRSQVMSDVLAHADLREPLTQHVRLVRSYEFLRCLGGTLLDGLEPANQKQHVEKLKGHGGKFGCWRDKEVSEETLVSYMHTVVVAHDPLKAAQKEVEPELDQLGFTPRGVRGSRVPASVLARLFKQFLDKVDRALLRDYCEEKGLRAAAQQADRLLELAEAVLEQGAACGERAEQVEPLRDFLVTVSEDYVSRAKVAGPTRCVNFADLAATDSRKDFLAKLEEQAEARRNLDDMASMELLALLELIHESFAEVHGPGHLSPLLESWRTRLGQERQDTLHPGDIGELSAALQDFLQQNRRACKLGEEDSILVCVVRALVGKSRATPHPQPNPAAGREGASSSELESKETSLGHFAPQATPQNAVRRVVACFGAEASPGASGNSCVVVRSVPLGLSGAGTGSTNNEDYEVRELGLRIGGMYRKAEHGEFSAKESCTAESVAGDVVLLQYEWVPPGEVQEDSKPLEQILNSVTHVRIILPEGSGFEEREVDLQTNKVHGDSAWYRAIPSRSRVSADAHGGFRRFVLEVGRGLRLPLPNGLLKVQPGGGVIETADVLAHVLALWFSQKHAREDMTAALRQRPALLYFASTALFECFDGLASKLMEALQRHWASVLGMSTGQPNTTIEAISGDSLLAPAAGGTSHAPLVQQEVQSILLELLTVRSDGKFCAVLPGTHLNEFCALVEKTRHTVEFMLLERFCFESALERIGALQDSTITFIIIEITGQISALQLGELVRCARGAIRLIFNFYHGLLPSLAVTRSVDWVLVPPSIANDLSHQVTPSMYKDSSALGQATLHSSRLMVQRPMELSPLANMVLPSSKELAAAQPVNAAARKSRLLDWPKNLAQVQQHMKDAHAWPQLEEEWRLSSRRRPTTDQADGGRSQRVLLLLVTADEALVREHYDALPEGAGVRCFSLHHSDRRALNQVETLLDRMAAHPQGNEEAGNASRSGLQLTLVLFGVSFVAPSKLADIVAHAYLGGHVVILVVQEPISAFRSVRVTTRHSTVYIHGTVYWVQSAVQNDAVGSLNSPTTAIGATGLRALRLVLGAAALPRDRQTALQAALDAEDISTCAELLQPNVAQEIASDLLAGVIKTLGVRNGGGGGRAEPSDPRAMAFAIGCLAASFVERAKALGLNEQVWDVSFPDFRAHLPVCRFLDQVSVAEAWCRYLDFIGTETQIPEKPDGTGFGGFWPEDEPERPWILSHWIPTSNAHCPGLEDLMEHAIPREHETEAFKSVLPAYYGPGPGHQSEAHEEVLERHCLQRRELDWGRFSDSWRTALDIKPDTFLRLASWGVDTLRLFLCLPPERAIELGLTHLLDAARSSTTSGGGSPAGVHSGGAKSAGGAATTQTPQARLSVQVVQKLVVDMECTVPLLEAVVSEGAGEVAARLAAVKWLLLTVLPEKEALTMLSGAGRIDEATVEQLVRAKVMLAPRGRDELLRRVVTIVLGLNGGDVLASQHEIKRFLLETQTPLLDLLPDAGAKVGRAIVSFMFSPDHTEQLKRRELGRAVTEGFERIFGFDVLRWQPLDGAGVQAQAQAEPHRVTAAAHAAVLERAPGPEVAGLLAKGPLLGAVSHLIQTEGAVGADSFLCNVLELLVSVPGSDTLVLAVLETLASTEAATSSVVSNLEDKLGTQRRVLQAARNPFIVELFAALRVQSLGNYLAMVAAHKGSIDYSSEATRPLQLALDGNTALRDMYLQHFRRNDEAQSSDEASESKQSATLLAALRVHNAILDDTSCAVLLKVLAEQGKLGHSADGTVDSASTARSDLFLIWYCWARSPDRQLPFWAVPHSPQQTKAFILACNGGPTKFVERCRPIGPGLSVFAKFLVAPEALPLGVYNMLSQQAPGVHEQQGSQIEAEMLLISQEDCEEYPPYCLRWHARSLPQPLKERLKRHCCGDVRPCPDAKSHHFYPSTTSGLSEKTLRVNLGLLISLHMNNQDLSVYFDHGADSQRHFVAACLMCWFKAAGLHFDDLLECVAAESKESFARLWHDLMTGLQKTGPTCLRKMYNRGPLPANIDVRWVEEGFADVPIFARTRDSALLTAQWLNMLIVHFNITDLQPFTPEDLVRVSGPRGSCLQTGPRLEGALDKVSQCVGAAVSRDLVADVQKKDLVKQLAADKYDTNALVTRLGVLTDFIALLRSTPGSLGQFFASLVSAMAAPGKAGGSPSEAHFAAVFDAFFVLLGITPENEGREIEELAKAYHTNGLPLSVADLEEIRWQHENYYGRRGKDSKGVQARVAAFGGVCEILSRIRSLQLKTVPFQRHFQQTVFVGDFLGEKTSDESVGPAYLQQRNFQLLCDRPNQKAHPSEQGREEAWDEQHVEAVNLGGTAWSEAFFTATGEDAGGTSTARARASGSWVESRRWDRPEGAEGAWQDSCPVIGASEILEVDAQASFYLHAPLRVRAGLQPILWRTDKTESFYRLSNASGLVVGQEKAQGQEGEICKAFATNAEAWQFIDRANSAVVTLEGLYLRKADDAQTWVVVFPSARPPDDPPLTFASHGVRQRRYCMWPLCHSHKLVNLGFQQDTLQVIQLLVWVAWHMADIDSKAETGRRPKPQFSVMLPLDITEPLRRLSTLSNEVEMSLTTQELPESDQTLAQQAQQLCDYQKYERHMAEVLLRILTKMKSQQRDNLSDLIVSESQRRSATMKVPFVDTMDKTNKLSRLGGQLQRLLVPIVSKAGIAGSPVTTKAWTQLELVLEACYRGEQMSRERCFAKHMHITKTAFARKGVGTLSALYRSQYEGRHAPTVQQFSDSEDELPTKTRLREQPHETPKEPAAQPQRKVQYFEAENYGAKYVDTQMDRDVSGGTALFDEPGGFGRPVNSRNAVLTFYDEDLPLYFVTLNRERLKIQYSASEGLCLGYLVHKNIFSELLEHAKQFGADSGGKGEDGLKAVRTLRMRLLSWIADVLRSPLPSGTKTWILRCCERMGMVAVAPYQEANQVNLALIAYCLCRCCPSGTEAALFLRSVLMNAWYIPNEIKSFIERKSDVYGLYVVRPGISQRMRELGLQVAVRDFEREVMQRSMNNSAMYLDIISHFSSYCCFTYVKGLRKIDDILLKWLAEYTRLHPWRFIFLENVDTSFNFPENRDRCNFRFAPPNPLHLINTIEELQSPYVAEIRPSHTIPYPERLLPSHEELQDPKRLFHFFAKQFAPESSDADQGLFSATPAPSQFSADFRDELERHLFGAQPCLVLLVSAPGAGKTHHMGALRGRLEGEMQFDIHEFDGSSDILVTTALAEVLQRTISTQSKSGQKLLILDEYHMLSDEHKDELFDWVRAKLGPSLRVVLIGNRIDSKDRERLEQSRPMNSGGGANVASVALIQTRLSRHRIEGVMTARGNSEKWREPVCDWLVGCRLVFGEESVSLRLCDTLEQALQRPDPRSTLVESLLHRVPTISRPTAMEFVSAYLRHVGLRSLPGSGAGASSVSGLVGLCFRIAMLDRRTDTQVSFVEFLERTPRAHEALPAVRLIAWCVYMMNAKGVWDTGASLANVWQKRRMFVDQVNFPFELGEEGAGSSCSVGPTFSWAGDPTSLRDLVDAVKRGHSVDWADVHKRVWALEHIKDSELFAQLLSSSRNPAMILQQVLPSNLCSLLRLSNTPAPTAVQLARIILRHAPPIGQGAVQESSVDRPRCLALWTVLLHDRQTQEPVELLRLAGGIGALLESLFWARDWATDRCATVAPGARVQLLQRILSLCCVQDQQTVELAQLALLWTGSFGRLLRPALLAHEELWKRKASEAVGAGMSAELCAHGDVPPALPQAKFLQVLQRVADVQEDWPAEVQVLWRIGHCRSTAREVSNLWTQQPHCLQDLASENGSRSLGLPVEAYYLPGIVAAPGTLCRSLQRALLCNNCQVPDGISPTAFVTACADALNEMRNADLRNTVCIGGPNGEAIQRVVHDEMAS